MALCSALMSGPISLASSRGSRTCTPATAGSNSSRNRSKTLRCTSIRDRAQQSWPALSNTAYGAVAAASARSASSNTMFALLPPSSSVTRFTWSAQPAMIALPTSVEPVKQILRTAAMRDKPLPDNRPATRQHSEHALGKPGLQRELAEPDRGQRRQFGRLQHHGVARRERGREAPAGDRHREVPRHDDADNAERLAKRDVDAARHRNLPSEHPLGRSGVVGQHIANVACLPTCIADRVPRVRDLELRQLF